jgi:hypothetical protein
VLIAAFGGRSDSRYELRRYALQVLDARPFEHPLYPRIDIAPIQCRVDAEFVKHQQARHKADIRDCSNRSASFVRRVFLMSDIQLSSSSRPG